jgi:apolipoprotein D and lipocalin family protein
VEGQPGVIRQIEGVAEIVAPGQLQVRLQGVPFPAKYWVLDISRDGRTLIVGTPARQGGWVLRRDPKVTPEQLFAAREVFERNGYDVAALQRTRQR